MLHPRKHNTYSFQLYPELFTRIDHILGHQKNLNTLKSTEIIQIMLLSKNGSKLYVIIEGK